MSHSYVLNMSFFHIGQSFESLFSVLLWRRFERRAVKPNAFATFIVSPKAENSGHFH